MKTGQSRQLPGGTWDPSWISKNGLVDRGYESQIPRAVSQPSDLYGKNKVKSDEVWWLGISLAAVLEFQAGVKISGASVRAGSSGQY